MCNDSPAAPELASNHTDYDPVAGNAYIAWGADENENYRLEYEKYCGVDECYNMMQMQNAL